MDNKGMEDKHRVPDEGGKRGLFAPIVLVLLTLSLIGNVFLYAQRLQSGQLEREDAGHAIIGEEKAAQAYFGAMKTHIEALAAADDAAERLKESGRMLQTAKLEAQTVSLIGKALALSPDSAVPDAATATAAIASLEQSIGAAVAHDGPLADGERVYLSGIGELFAKLAASADELDTTFDTSEAALQANAGGPWVEAAKSWSVLLSQAEAFGR